MLDPGQEALEELTPSEENQLVSTDLAVITDQCYIGERLEVLDVSVASDEVLFEERVVQIVSIHAAAIAARSRLNRILIYRGF